MTPTMDANASLDSVIDSSIDSVNAEPSADAVDTTSDVTTDAPDELAEPVDTPVEGDQTEAQPEAEAQPVEEQPEEDDPDDDLSRPDRKSRDGKMLYYREGRIKKFLQSHQAWNAVQEAVPGATIDQIKQHYETAAAADELFADIDNGNWDKALGFFTGASTGADPQMVAAATAQLAETVLPFLAQNNPQALKQVEGRVMQVTINRLYKDAQAKNDQRLFKLAQNLDHVTNGKFLTPDQIASKDALSEREAAIAARERQFTERTAAEQRAARERWTVETQKADESAVSDLIAKSIPDTVKKAFAGKPQERWIANEFREKIAEAIKANPAWERQYKALLARDQAQPSEQTRNALVSMKTQFAQPIIAKHRKAVIEAATGTVLSASAAAHQRQAAAAAKREPVNAGAPVQGASIDKVKDAKSMDEVFKAIGW